MPLIKAKLDNYCCFFYSVILKGLETKIKNLKTKDNNSDAN